MVRLGNMASFVLWMTTLFMNRACLTAAMNTGCTTLKKGALVFLHGLGDSPADVAAWSSLEYTLPLIQPRLKDITYVFPPVPNICLTVNGGMQMPGWFDLYDWPIAVGSRDDRKGKMAALARLDMTLQRLEEEEGIDPSRIVLAGFSQGGAVALLSAYQRREQPFAACVSLSAWLTLVDELDVDQEAKKTPLLWAHGRDDDKVLFEQQAFGVQKLREQGVEVIAKDYDMGHESAPEEIEAMATFLDEIFFGDEVDIPEEISEEILRQPVPSMSTKEMDTMSMTEMNTTCTMGMNTTNTMGTM